MNEEIINAIINAIGSLGEITATYYKTLINNGLPEEVASELSIAFITKFTEISFAEGHREFDEDD